MKVLQEKEFARLNSWEKMKSVLKKSFHCWKKETLE
jgi:hypothetical protein